MGSPFAALEARTTGAVFEHLANAEACATTRFGAVVHIPVIFDNGYNAVLTGRADATQPTAMVRSSDVVDLVQGCEIIIGGSTWSVADAQPDGTGMTLLVLRTPSA